MNSMNNSERKEKERKGKGLPYIADCEVFVL